MNEPTHSTGGPMPTDGQHVYQRNPIRREPVLAPPAEILQRYNARVLDPTTAVVIAGQAPIRPTVYIADRLIVSGAADQPTQGALAEAARRHGYTLILDEPGKGLRAPEVAARAQLPAAHLPIRLRLVPNSAAPTPAPDAWTVLQTFRSLVPRDSPAQRQVAIDHLLTASSSPDIGGSPYVWGHGVGGTPYVWGHAVGSYQYGMPGSGGRQPVNWLGAPPARTACAGRRPVVAVLDTGVGAHPWLPSPEVVRLEAMVQNVPIANPEATGVTMDPYEGVLDQDAGHGTFIAGLIRQYCPDADILAIPIMGGDGVVAESNLLDAVWLLLLRQQIAIAAGNAADIVDVVSLSLGYYHEQPDDIAFDPQLLTPLRLLGELGVAVVCAAGNDATDRPMFPAAFTPWAGGLIKTPDSNCVPIVSVGATNPNRTVALFSNAGAWVCCHRPGAALVSTFPTTFNGSEQPSFAVVDGKSIRATIDPDDFASGFGIWSGTSFAGPVLAGQLAAQLCQVDLSAVDRASAVTRGWAAVSACVPRLQQ